LAVRVGSLIDNGLEPGDSRGVFKNVNVDMRQYKRLKMFMHAEALPSASGLDTGSIVDDEMIGFIRFGTDLTDNFYQVEKTLKKTQFNDNTREDVWPEANNMDLSLELITRMKILALKHVYAPGEIYYPDDDPAIVGGDGDESLRLGIRGNPNFGQVRIIMLGVKNNTNRLNTSDHPLNPRRIKGEVWFNELRLAQMDNKGGMAAVASFDGNIADFANVSATGKMTTIGFGALEQGPNERSREDDLQYNVVTNMSLGKLLPKKYHINLPFNYAIGEEFITPKYDPYYQDIELKQLLDITTDPTEKKNIKDRAIDYTKRKSINFIGVKKERGEKQKPHFYDPENVTLSYTYNQVDRHSYELQSYLDQKVSTTADYAFAFQPKPVEPLKNVKLMKKSSYWKMLSDFNFNYLPSNLTFSSNITRQYNRQQFRLVDVEGIGIDALYQRNYLFNYQYGFNYNLSKSLKVNFNATSNNIVRNYMRDDNTPDNSYTVWTDYWNVGTPNQHNQQITVNYELPLSKMPFLSFVKSNYTYAGTYNWQRSSIALSSVIASDGLEYNLGNTIQNSGSHKLNTELNMETFYKFIGLSKSKQAVKAPVAAAPKPGEKVTAVKVAPIKDSNVFVDGLKGLLMCVKNIKVNYTENQGTLLPGFLPSVGFFGTSKPTLGFGFGWQDDVRFEAAKNGWLTTYPDFNQNYTHSVTKTLDFAANVDLFPDFKIDLSANRSYTDNYTEQYDMADGHYNSRSPYDTGNFAISTVMLRSSFRRSDEFYSSSFEDFRNNRLIIANRLALNHYGTSNFPVDADGFPVGYGKGSSEVLLPSFWRRIQGLIFHL
jgi:cell surface protein SprA